MQKNGYTFAIVYSSKCVSVFLHQTLDLTFEVWTARQKFKKPTWVIYILQNVCLEPQMKYETRRDQIIL